jgi:hypothetical protein
VPPLAGIGRVSVAVPAPGAGFGCWAGAPSAAFDADGEIVLAYRLRDAERRGGEVVVGGITLGKERFGAESLERPALVRVGGGWRLYLSCATPGSKHWWICALDAPSLAGLAQAEPVTVFAGDAETGVKDPVVRRDGAGWQAWICCHPLDEPGEEDRMTTAYATSDDGAGGAAGSVGRARGAGHRGAPRRDRVLRRARDERRELPGADGHRRRCRAGRGRPLPRRPAAAGRRLAALLRGAAP